MKHTVFVAMLSLFLLASPIQAQEAVKASANPDALFVSADPKLNANKQVVYHIIRDLLEAGHWDKAGDYLTETYIQHNPNAKSGRKAVVQYFTEVLKVEPQPIPPKLSMKIVAVMAEGDLVTVIYPRTVKDPTAPGGAYSTAWFDTWRIENGKVVEHWDPALLNEAPDLR